MAPMPTRAIKEARLLLPPAAMILGATALSALWPAVGLARPFAFVAARIGLLAFVLGIPLLAATPVGAEFQQHTMSLLLAQPIGRRRLWAEKEVAAVLVTVIVAGVQLAVLDLAVLHALRPVLWLFAVTMVCSAAFWTLVARSIVGGLAFSLASWLMLEVAGGLALESFGYVSYRWVFLNHPALNAARVAYSALTLWLGWRAFSRFQIASAAHADLSGSAARLPLPDVLRCRPTGVLANMVRVELRLHRPTFFVAVLFAAIWLVALTAFAIHPVNPAIMEATFTSLVAVYVLLALVLAGTISLGESASLGLHEWELTLPIRARTAWLLKLSAALVIAALLVFALPAALSLLTSATLPVQRGILLLVPTSPAAVLIFAGVVLGFWSATFFGPTVRAAVAAGVVAVAFGAFVVLGFQSGARAGIFAGPLAWVMVRFQLWPTAFLPRTVFLLPVLTAIVLAPVVLVALRQSLTAYRRVRPGTRTAVRAGAGLMAVAFLGAFAVAAYTRSAASVFESTPVRELRAALQAVVKSDAPDERRVSPDELVATGRLSSQTQRWIAGADIRVKGPTRRPGGARRPTPLQRAFFRASIAFPNGRHDTLLVPVER